MCPLPSSFPSFLSIPSCPNVERIFHHCPEQHTRRSSCGYVQCYFQRRADDIIYEKALTPGPVLSLALLGSMVGACWGCTTWIAVEMTGSLLRSEQSLAILFSALKVLRCSMHTLKNVTASCPRV